MNVVVMTLLGTNHTAATSGSDTLLRFPLLIIKEKHAKSVELSFSYSAKVIVYSE